MSDENKRPPYCALPEGQPCKYHGQWIPDAGKPYPTDVRCTTCGAVRKDIKPARDNPELQS